MRISANVQTYGLLTNIQVIPLKQIMKGTPPQTTGWTLVDIPSPAHLLSVLILTFNNDTI